MTVYTSDEQNTLPKMEMKLSSCCSSTDECLPDLGKTLQDEHCRLKKLRLNGNKFTEKGRTSIDEIAALDYCKTRGLEIHTRW